MKRTTFIIALFLAIICIISALFLISYKKTIRQASEISNLEVKMEKLKKDLAESEDEKVDLEKKNSALEELEKHSYHYSISVPGISGNNDVGSNGVATVVYRKASCDYFILENSKGYIVAEWFGGTDPDINDKITGSLNSFGFKDLYNQTHDSECRFWIDDYMLSKEDAMEKIQNDCN